MPLAHIDLLGHLRKGDLFLEMLLHVLDRIADDEASGGVFLLFALLFFGRFLPVQLDPLLLQIVYHGLHSLVEFSQIGRF